MFDLITSCLSAHRLSSFQSLMLKGKDNITSFFSPNVKNICWRSSLTWALVCLSWSIMWDWAFPIPCLTRKTYLHVDCTWLYLNTSLTPPLVPRSLEKGGAAESFPGTAVNMSTCKSAVIIYLHIMKRMITTTLILLINHVFNFPPTAACFFNQIRTFPNLQDAPWTTTPFWP